MILVVVVFDDKSEFLKFFEKVMDFDPCFEIRIQVVSLHFCFVNENPLLVYEFVDFTERVGFGQVIKIFEISSGNEQCYLLT